jgi:predicted O-methyltransferase YrrM
VVRKGEIADPASADKAVQAMRRFYERLADEPRVAATAIQTVGTKGYDGFAIALVTA